MGRLSMSLGIVLAVVLGAALPCAADRTAAEFFVQRGDKALRDKDWTTAQEQFRKAIEEDPENLPALSGLAEALLAAGDRTDGLKALRRAGTVANGGATMPAAWGIVAARVRKRLGEVDVAGTALDRIVEKHTADLAAYANRWIKKDPEAAAAAFEDMKRLRPDDKRTKQLGEALSRIDEATWLPLFNGKDGEGWLYLSAPTWTIQQGVIVCNLPSEAVGTRTKATYAGDYDIRVEAKLVELHDPKGFFAIMSGIKSHDDHSTLSIAKGRLLWMEEHAPKKFDRLFDALEDKLPKSFDANAWTVYEIRIRGENVQLVVNGEVVTSFSRPAGRDTGAIGLKVERAHTLVRRVEYRPR